jgi:hypothetical protein
MKHCVSLIDENNNLETFYLKANQYICSSFLGQSDNKKQAIKQFWKEKFDVDLDLDDRTICFKTDKQKMVFLLRWS